MVFIAVASRRRRRCRRRWDKGRPQKKAKFLGRVASVVTPILFFIGFRRDGRWVSFWFYFGARLSHAPFSAAIPGSAFLIPDLLRFSTTNEI
jgi:hypothetical protein